MCIFAFAAAFLFLEEMVGVCPLCSSYAAKNLKCLLRHLGAVHSHEAGFFLRCSLQDCPCTYNNFHSYRKHLYTKHRDVLGLDLSTTSEIPEDTDMSTVADINTSYISDDPLEDDIDNDDVTTAQEEKRAAALFALKAMHVHKVSQSSLSDLMLDISTMLEFKVHQIESNVIDALKNSDPSLKATVKKYFHSHSVVDPFCGLTTSQRLKAFFKDQFQLLEPIERKLGRKIITTRRRGRSSFKTTWDYVYIIPFISSLEQILSDEFILEQVLQGHQRHDGLLSDYCDGQAYKSHPLFSTHSSDNPCLEIILYYDDAEVCNPLGSRSKKHKLALFYYTLGNIAPKNRSTLRCIQLLAVVKSTLLQKYGVEAILQPFIEDLKSLEQESGLTLKVKGHPISVRGTLTVVPADNLASHYLGGYKSLSSALRKCRHCMAVAEDMSTKFVSEDFEPRTRETHADHCEALLGPLHDHFAIAFGLTENSILNSLRYFHVTEGLAPDVMHDLLEGVLPYEVKELLKCLIRKKMFTLRELNTAIESFPYSGSDATNKPIPIAYTTLTSSDHHLKQTATQMWCFGRLLPLIIGEKVPEDDENWCNFLILLEIMDYLLAPTLKPECVGYVKFLIKEHHEGFKKIYPLCKIIPKIHYLIHYPEFIEMFGPPIQYGCMRYEGKHNYFKDMAHRVKCFKNIPKTMARKHQESLCYHLNSMTGGSPFTKNTTVGPATEITLRSLPYMNEVLDALPNMDSTAIRVSWVEIGGTKYSENHILVLQNNLLPLFGVIQEILHQFGKYYFVCKLLHTECFSAHYHSYEVSLDTSYTICTISDLADHHPLSMYTLNSHSMYICMKYYVTEHIDDETH